MTHENQIDEEALSADAAVEAPAEVTEEVVPQEQAAAGEPRRRVPRPLRRARRRGAPRDGSEGRKPIVRLPKPEHQRGEGQERRGVVVSSVMDKTIVVKVDTIKAHPRYKKVVRRSRKFHAHDERNQAGVGDTVRIVESRPISKTKTWRLAEVLEKAR